MPRNALQVLKYVAISVIVWVVAGFLIGALLGAGMTWHNNNVLTDSPQGSYVFWSRFTGLFGAAIALPIGVLIGLIVGITRREK
jgi:cbb3-type cytochrome oxidase subunit 1